MTDRNYSQILYFVIIISFVGNSILFLPFDQLSFAQKDDEEDEEDKDQLVVKAQINLKNIDLEKTKFIRVIGFINGEESKKDIPISSIDKSENNLDVELKTHYIAKDNELYKWSSRKLPPNYRWIVTHVYAGIQIFKSHVSFMTTV